MQSNPERPSVPSEHTWDLEALYSSMDLWNNDVKTVESLLPKLEEFSGKLGDGKDILASAIEAFLEASRIVEKLYTYAHLLSDGDTSNSTHQGYLDIATNLYTRFGAAASYLTPELIGLESSYLEKCIADKDLARFARMLREIVRFKPHTLSESSEGLLAQASEIFGSTEKVFSQLTNADLQFGSLVVDGKETALTHGSFQTLLKHEDRSVRKEAWDKYYAVFDGHKNTLAAALSGSIKKDVYIAKVRNHPSALTRALFSDNISPDVYNNLIDTVSENLGSLHRWYQLRAKVLNLKDLTNYDTYVPIVKGVKTSYSYEQASEYILEALTPLGDEYVTVLRKGFLQERWVDRYENRGKRSGAYSGGCYDSYPYMLMNYKDDSLNDMFTLAHEAGHSMHSYFSRKHQAYHDSDYTIFVAEVASTFNEQLLSKHLRRVFKDNHSLVAYLINQEMDEIEGTFFRQTMYAEFERETHALAEANQPLTVDVFRELYGKLLTKYYGPAVKMDPNANIACLRIPHFYWAFYVYKYATGISAAIDLSRKVLNGGKPDLDRYLKFLSSGCSKLPLDQLKDAGVDMSKPEPIRNTITTFNDRLNELEELLK